MTRSVLLLTVGLLWWIMNTWSRRNHVPHNPATRAKVSRSLVALPSHSWPGNFGTRGRIMWSMVPTGPCIYIVMPLHQTPWKTAIQKLWDNSLPWVLSLSNICFDWVDAGVHDTDKNLSWREAGNHEVILDFQNLGSTKRIDVDGTHFQGFVGITVKRENLVRLQNGYSTSNMPFLS